eukprot:gene9771-11577_t
MAVLAMKERAEQYKGQLKVHLSQSKLVCEGSEESAADAEPQVPRWLLSCSRGTDLQRVCDSYLNALDDFHRVLEQRGLEDDEEKRVVRSVSYLYQEECKQLSAEIGEARPCWAAEAARAHLHNDATQSYLPHLVLSKMAVCVARWQQDLTSENDITTSRPAGDVHDLNDALPPDQTVLSALGSSALGAEGEEARACKEAQLVCGLVAQLQLLPDMSEWAVYVAMHLQDPRARQELVKMLLCAQCEEWSQDKEKVEFLRDTLRVPESLLAEASAQLAHYQRQWLKELQHRIKACQWAPAHSLLVERTAPGWFCQGEHAKLQETLDTLANYQPLIEGWSRGAGLYARFYKLEQLCNTEGAVGRQDAAEAAGRAGDEGRAAGDAEMPDELSRAELIQVWQLLLVLYGRDCPSPEGNDEEMEVEAGRGRCELPGGLGALQWRKALTAWLKTEIKHDPNNRLAMDIQQARATGGLHAHVLRLLSAHETLEATKLLVQDGADVRLGTVLAQGGGNKRTQKLLQHQLTVWGDHGISEHIGKERLLVYKLLAGRVTEVIQSMPEDSLDWRRAFGLYLWYEASPTASLEEVLEQYQAALQARRVPIPLPYYEEVAAGPRRTPHQTTSLDLTYHLLCVAGGRPHTNMLLSSTFSADPLDNSLSWHLERACNLQSMTGKLSSLLSEMVSAA